MLSRYKLKQTLKLKKMQLTLLLLESADIVFKSQAKLQFSTQIKLQSRIFETFPE